MASKIPKAARNRPRKKAPRVVALDDAREVLKTGNAAAIARVRDFAMACMDGELKAPIMSPTGEVEEVEANMRDRLAAGRLALTAIAALPEAPGEGLTEAERRDRIARMLNG